VPILGTLLKNKRAGDTNLAWNLPALAGPAGLSLQSAAFDPEGAIPRANAGKRAGGQNESPELSWAGVPAGTAQLLLVIQDVDSPTSVPFVHCVALIEPQLTGVPGGALNSGATVPGVRSLRSGMGRGYLGTEPIKGHGPHRYVFQLFALAAPVTLDGGADLADARPKAVLAAVSGPVLARGRLDGLYTRS
jgi:Raf kinase inhibitor-like YbhB/YbcL family protein